MLAPSFDGLPEDLTEENLQPRIRGMVLMALSNKFRGWLVLTTGNKSELAVGYSTLYGDTAGGFAVIKDVPKLLVYDLCRLHNERAGREVIPEAVLTKPPSAELRPDQRDDQSLPPYEVLDPLLEAYVEDDLTRGELIAQGFDPAMVDRITRLVDISEYKRRQNPPGPAHQRQGVRQGPAHADHERLPRVTGAHVTIRAVLFDFAGVLTSSSPWAALAEAGGGDLELIIGSYEQDTDHPWHQVERGEMTIVDWMTAVTRARRGQGRRGRLLAAAGAARRHDGARSDRRPRPRAPRPGLQARRSSPTTCARARRCGGRWCPSTSCSTSWSTAPRSGCASPTRRSTTTPSRRSGASRPSEAVFLDDTPGNVDGARRAGLHAILVETPEQAIEDLTALADESAATTSHPT